eukprot:CAMPEP_0197530966 /NCGR_PEP_ID=MMETSP1318-20131121/33593_1 /TAXON_ID=552666 /ORGANISM="Partenskyella glossopodia, Strain RCC365" /LENGTH=299 /DNA_ID=CAMNT_0043086995 /DNA_START=3 /DNA_END=902 /DNA_ORIENTATION=+
MLREESDEKEGRLNCEVISSNYPYHPLTVGLPALHDQKLKVWVKPKNVISHFCSKTEALDSGFAPSVRAQILACRDYLTKQLLPTIDYVSWKDKSNFRITRSKWAEESPAVIQSYLQWRERRRVLLDLEREDCSTNDKALKRAETCLQTITEWFGLDATKPYLFDSVSSADATLAGLLFCIFESDLPRNKLRRMVHRKFPVLKSYCLRVTQRFIDPAHEFPRQDFDAEDPDAESAKNKRKKSAREIAMERWFQQKFGVKPPEVSVHTAANMMTYVILGGVTLHLVYQQLTQQNKPSSPS